MKALQPLISEYRNSMKNKNGASFLSMISYNFDTVTIPMEINYIIRNKPLEELLKDFRVMLIGQFSRLNSAMYNRNIRWYEFERIHCLDIYVKYKYIIKFRYTTKEAYITIEGNYPIQNTSPTEIPKALETEIREIIHNEVTTIMNTIKQEVKLCRQKKKNIT